MKPEQPPCLSGVFVETMPFPLVAGDVVAALNVDGAGGFWQVDRMRLQEEFVVVGPEVFPATVGDAHVLVEPGV
jgi:hypothetical protein